MKKKPEPTPDHELLDLHYKELAMPQPTQEFEVPGPGEEEEEEEQEEEVGPNAAPAVPTPLAPTPARKRGRPRGRSAGVAGAPPPDDNDGWPIQAVEVWERIVHDELPKRGLSPEHVYCTVFRYGLGAFSGGLKPEERKDQVYVARIEGPSIAGTPSTSPGEALTDYMETVVHPQAGNQARYELRFNILGGSTRGGGRIGVQGHMTLPHPTEIARRRAFAGEYAVRQQMSGAADPMMGPPAMPRTGYGQPPPPYPPPPYYPPPPPQYFSSPPAQDSGEVAAMRRDLATVLGRFDEIARRDAEARGAPPPPPIAPQVVPPPVESEDARIARLLDAALERRGVGVRPVGVGAAPAAIAPAGVVEQAKVGIGALREFMGMFKELDKFRREVGLGAEPSETVVETPPPIVEDPNSPAFGVRPIPFSNFQGKPVMWPKPQLDEEGNEVEESMLSRLMKFGAANPDLSLAVLERASKVLSQGAFAQLLQGFTAQGGQAAQAAATMADRVVSGVGSPNGAPPPTGYPSP